MELPKLSKVLAGSEYEEHIECIDRVVSSMKIVTTTDLENSVRFIGPKLCAGLSTNKFISYVVAWCKNPPPEPVAPVRAKRKTTRKKKAVEPEPEVVVDVSEFAVEAQTDNDNAVEDALIDLSKE